MFNQEQTRYESTKEFRPIWEAAPVGTVAYKVKTYNDSGDCVGIEYTLDREDLEDMKEVSEGYFTDTWKMTK